MNDNKDYISQVQESGAVHISEDVLISIASIATSEVEGVAGFGSMRTADISDILTKKGSSKGVRITIGENNDILVDCNIIIKIGNNIMDVAKNVQETVKTAIESVTGFAITEVNVVVSGIALPKEPKK